MDTCPPALITIRSAVEYAALARAEKTEPDEPEYQKPKPRRAPGSRKLSRSEVSRLGAIARWARWRAKNRSREK
jgi:hypothetical protein